MTEIEFIPLGDRVIIEPDAIKDVTSGGIIIPDASKKQLPVGIVIALGKGIKSEDSPLEVGDKVLYHESAGGPIDLEEGTFLMMGEFEIKGILKKAGK
jgi:chaperonin GroES